jgi:hypothetical protein
MKQTFWRKTYKILSEGYNILLIFLLLLLTFRPINSGFIYIAAWELCFAAVFFMSIFVCSHHKFVRTAAMVTGIPAILLSWSGLYFQVPVITVSSIILTITFILICTASVLHREVFVSHGTWKSLTPVICAYFLIGFAFAYGFVLIEFIYPGVLKIENPDSGFFGHGEYLSEAVSMSFASLLAMTTPDPSTPSFMETMIYVEGMLSQFYLAALTSRIVSIYRTSRKAQEKEGKAVE